MIVKVVYLGFKENETDSRSYVYTCNMEVED